MCGVWFPGCDLVWAVWVWAGLGACLAEGWAADRRALVCGVVGLSGAGIGDAPAAGGLLRSCGCGGLVGGGCPRACVWGWHAVGVLG